MKLFINIYKLPSMEAVILTEIKKYKKPNSYWKISIRPGDTKKHPKINITAFFSQNFIQGISNKETYCFWDKLTLNFYDHFYLNYFNTYFSRVGTQGENIMNIVERKCLRLL